MSIMHIPIPHSETLWGNVANFALHCVDAGELVYPFSTTFDTSLLNLD